MKDKLRIVLTGDLLPGNTPYNVRKGIASRLLSGESINWEKALYPLFHDSDLVITNLESALSKDNYKVKELPFLGPANLAQILKECGVTHVNLANNHILQHGHEQFSETVEILKNAGLELIGSNPGGPPSVSFFLINNLRIGLAGFNDINSQKTAPGHVLSEENIIHSLNEMKKSGADLRILSFHWGEEYVQIPSPRQQKLAKFALDHGADIIYGHHPHVIQPVEEYQNGLIFYSLGNFIFDSRWSSKLRYGLMAEIVTGKEGIISWNARTIRIGQNDLPVPADSALFEKVQAYFKAIDPFNQTTPYDKKAKRIHQISRVLMKTEILRRIIPFDKKAWKNFLARLLKKI